MKNLELRSSLIKSGLLIGLFIFLIYAFAVDGSGGIGGTFASLFAGITFLIGLSIAVVVSVVIMFGVYFGILYLYNPAVSAKTFAELKVNISNVSEQLCSCESCSVSATTPDTVPVITGDDLQPLQATQDSLAGQLAKVGSSVDSIQKTLAELNASIETTQQNIDTIGEKTAAIEEELGNKASTDAINDASKKLTADISAIKTSVQPLNDKIASLEETVSEKDDTSGTEETNKAIAALQKELEALKKKLAEKEAKAESTVKSDKETTEEADHRILSYFTKKADEKKFVALVKDSVDQDMTYAQVDEYLNKSLSKAAAKVISEHPSLTKDYIRECRQKG